MRVTRSKLLTLSALLVGLAETALAADPGVAEQALAPDTGFGGGRPWKLTFGDYQYSGYSGQDFNLRWQRSDTHAWLGAYTDSVFGTQGRAGVDTSVDLGGSVQLQPSLQVATRGFLGGSLSVQAGDSWFALAGIGRTNLKPYFNLNFDPNDALTFGAGHHSAAGTSTCAFPSATCAQPSTSCARAD
jgi:hypothetical protein